MNSDHMVQPSDHDEQPHSGCLVPKSMVAIDCSDPLCQNFKTRPHVEAAPCEPTRVLHVLAGTDSTSGVRVSRIGDEPWTVEIVVDDDLDYLQARALANAILVAAWRVRAVTDSPSTEIMSQVARTMAAEGRDRAWLSRASHIAIGRLERLFDIECETLTLSELARIAHALHRDLASFFAVGSN